MSRWLTLAALALILAAAPAGAADITGKYVEARTCDVWTGPCFANAEMNITGKNAVLGWKVDKGMLDNVKLDGLSVVAVVAASDTLGLEQTGPAKALVLVDEKATDAQRDALIRLARKQAGKLLDNIVSVEKTKVAVDVIECKDGGCARLEAGKARVETRCLDQKHDKACGNESAFYPPLSHGVKAQAAMAAENSFQGKGFNQTWRDTERRGAYVGSFEIR